MVKTQEWRNFEDSIVERKNDQWRKFPIEKELTKIKIKTNAKSHKINNYEQGLGFISWPR